MWPQIKLHSLFSDPAAALSSRVRQLAPAPRFPPATEYLFELERRQKRLVHYRFTVWLTLVLYNAFLLMDYFCVRQRFDISLVVRLGMITPIALFCLFAVSRFKNKKLDVLLALSPLSAMAGVLIIYNTTVNLIAIGQIDLIIMLTYSINAMWPSFKYACGTIFFVTLGDCVYLAANPALDTLKIAMFCTQIWSAALLSLLASYWMERQERTNYMLRLEVESQVEELARISLIDALTGIPNRRRFDSELRTQWKRCMRGQEALAVLMIDLDHFKILNDRHGHAYGDEVLRLVAKTIREALRGKQDMVARYGGEEFIAILPNRLLDSATVIAERLCAAVRAAVLPAAGGDPQCHATVSIGIAALVPTPEASPADLLRTADAALYQAKAHGRDRVWSKTAERP